MSVIVLLVIGAGGFLLAAVIGAMVVVAVQNRRVAASGGYRPAPSPPQLSGEIEADVRAMLAQGQKIQAIKHVRERTGLGLTEAKDYVDALEAGTAPAAPAARLTAEPREAGPAAVEAEARALVARGSMIQAIKLVRERTGLGLKEAKDYVEDLAKRT